MNPSISMPILFFFTSSHVRFPPNEIFLPANEPKHRLNGKSNFNNNFITFLSMILPNNAELADDGNGLLSRNKSNIFSLYSVPLGNFNLAIPLKKSTNTDASNVSAGVVTAYTPAM